MKKTQSNPDKKRDGKQPAMPSPSSSSSTPHRATEKAAVRGASLLISLQIASRAVTFIANQLLLRYLTASLLGLSAQLEVYYLSVLFFARESLRVAVQRQKTTTSGPNTAASDARRTIGTSYQAVVNLGYLAVLLGAFVAPGLAALYLSSVDDSIFASTPYFLLSLRIYAIAAILELLSEPVFVLLQVRLQFGPRATAESLSTFFRCVVTLGSAVVSSRAGLDLGPLPFALGQLAYGLGLLLVYLWVGAGLASADDFSLLPRKLTNLDTAAKDHYLWSFFYRPTVSLASSMMAQSLVKHVLTQGDTFLVSILSTPQAQGVYALANNYGGLLARLVFQPIEESSRSYFSRLLSSQEGKAKEEGGAESSSSNTASKSTLASPSKEAVRTAAQHLHIVFKLYVLLSTVIVSVGPIAAPPLLSLIAGRRWASEGAGDVLATYCYYIPLLALNGVAEAFVASVASEAQVHRQSAWMGAFSLAFAAAGFLFLRVLGLGAAGLVYANCINMACRIIWSLAFIGSSFAEQNVPFSVSSLRPSPIGGVVMFVAPQLIRNVTGVTSRSAGGLGDVVKVAVAAVPFVLLVLFGERRIILQCYEYVRKGKTP
ncbi:Rft-1-domain-containing protein [Sodiomyces alkalinus F11]|uniref:Man(5)GlcNAc(2)-PP-dolichol translocation protein RFT1 n=1 Tax=Sodiomyces alkalinus (strain CBS 110278 / VKM F-3762 / F11) TaxID=1314773 RepID=A0A3N2PPV3_SODAK|nr:Rft-1-domain-containing protein [Sodiomyces alkalinus F11]ROT36543.1 Rft-1-domain-containing protein [Sodiomyces alkalinus F11]